MVQNDDEYSSFYEILCGFTKLRIDGLQLDGGLGASGEERLLRLLCCV